MQAVTGTFSLCLIVESIKYAQGVMSLFDGNVRVRNLSKPERKELTPEFGIFWSYASSFKDSNRILIV